MFLRNRVKPHRQRKEHLRPCQSKRLSRSVRRGQQCVPLAALVCELTLPMSLSRVFASDPTSALRNLRPLCRVTRTETFYRAEKHTKQKEREGESETYRDRETHKVRETQTETETYRDRDRHTETAREAQRQTNRQGQRHRHRGRHRERATGREKMIREAGSIQAGGMRTAMKDEE